MPATRRLAAWLREIPAWAILVFSAAIALAYSPNVLQVFGIHGDYEMLYLKGPGFFHPEAGHLVSLARPVAALFTNLTILPLHSLADFRWTRIFSILTVCFLGTLVIANCIFYLRTRTLDAVVAALAIFLVPPFIYSTLQPAAWAPHLLTIAIALCAYALLSASNLQAVAFLGLAERQDGRALLRQAFVYAGARPVWRACLVYQIALYDYPPNALIIAAFPVIAVLFSRAPRAYRTLIALRDIVFVGVNLVLYSVSAKLIYFPIIGLFTSAGTAKPPGAELTEFEARVGAVYRYSFNTHPGEVLGRLGKVMNVAGDLWFLPQARFHLVAGATIVLAIVAASCIALLARRTTGFRAILQTASIGRLTVASWRSEGVVTLLVVVVCMVIASAPVVASGGGFVSYRTIAVATAVVAIVFTFAVYALVGALWNVAGNPLSAAGRVADGAMALTICAAVAGSFYMNFLTMKLARNEYAYFASIVRQAIDDKANAIMIVDPRPFSLPEDHPVLYDQQGRAIPPYELGCLSGYCIQTGTILHIVAADLGRPIDEFRTYGQRANEPVPGMTCEMLAGPTATYPPNASARSVSIIKFLRTLLPITCVNYSLAWHDIGR